MKRVLLAMMMVIMISVCTACQKEESDEVIRTFIAGYNEGSEEDVSCDGARVLMNLFQDGTAEFYVAQIEDGVHTTAQYKGTYTLGENAEYDETISISYSYAEAGKAEIKEAVIIDGCFEMPFYFIDEMSEQALGFYETSPASMDGEVYIGYKTKVSGMGPMVYAYALCLKEDNSFDVSIMQMASVMHVWGETSGTYAADGENVTFTYDICTSEGELVSADEISEGTNYTDTTLVSAFNIEQASMRATAAPFIKVK